MITHNNINLNKRFENYETTGALYRQIQQDLLELTLYERLLRILAKVVLILAEILGIDINEGMKRNIKNESIPQQLINIVEEIYKARDSQLKPYTNDSTAA